MRAVISEDLVTGSISGPGAGGPVIPAAMTGFPLDRLRYNGAAIVDAAAVTSWHIDATGTKRLTASDGRQPLTCAWDAPLARDGETWRIRTAADALIEHANVRQWAVATGGVVADLGSGVTLAVPTDSTGLTLVNGAVSRVNADSPPAIIRWQTGPASFVTLTAAQVKTLGNVVADHVQGTFDTLDSVLADIADGTIATTAEIDAAFA